jgi:hypothetical protein
MTSVVNGVTVTISPTDSLQIENERKGERFKMLVDSIEASHVSKLFTTIKNVAQTTVGIRVDQLSSTQVRALFAIILFKESAIDTSLKIKPLSQWVK